MLTTPSSSRTFHSPSKSLSKAKQQKTTEYSAKNSYPAGLSRETLSNGGAELRTLRPGDRDFWLVPFDDSPNSQPPRAQRSQLQRFDDRGLEQMNESEYEALPAAKKRVRLLKLRSGTTHGPEIFCELIEADYNNSFHILTEVSDPSPLPKPKDQKEADERLKAE